MEILENIDLKHSILLVMDYRLFVLADGCMDPDDEVYRLLMTKVFPRQATVIDTATFAQMIGKKT